METSKQIFIKLGIKPSGQTLLLFILLSGILKEFIYQTLSKKFDIEPFVVYLQLSRIKPSKTVLKRSKKVTSKANESQFPASRYIIFYECVGDHFIIHYFFFILYHFIIVPVIGVNQHYPRVHSINHS